MADLGESHRVGIGSTSFHGKSWTWIRDTGLKKSGGNAGRADAMAVPDPLDRGSSDLRFLLQRQGIEDDHQRKLFTAGVDTLDKFSAFATGEPDLFAVLKDEFGLDPSASLAARGQVASFVAAWKASKVRVQRQAEVEAEQDTREWTKPIPTAEYLLLRQAYTKAHGTLDEKVLPSKEYLEKKLQEIEHGEFKAESLQEVTTRDELDPDTLIPVWDSKGVMTVKRGSSRVALPSNPEELRRRLNIMRNAYLMLRLKFPGRADLQDLEIDLFERYKEYLLGDYVHNLQARDSADSVVHTPPWQLVLSYEQAIRKQAFHYMVMDSIAMGAAWEKAWKDPVTKERHFSTPLSLYAKRKPEAPQGLPPRETWITRPPGKGRRAARETRGEAVDPPAPSRGMRLPGPGNLYVSGSTPRRVAPWPTASSSKCVVIASIITITSLAARSASPPTRRGNTDSAPMGVWRFTVVSCESFTFSAANNASIPWTPGWPS